MTQILKTITPVNGGIYVERPLATPAEAEAALARARVAQAEWQRVPVSERARLLSAAVDAFVAAGPEIAREITWQMGRPVRYTPGEVRGFDERARYMISVAEGALADIDVGPKEGFRRFIRRDPLGTVFVIAPWNYPYLTAVNAVIPALMAGNAVILKHSHQTPLCAERFAEALSDLPPGVFQHIHADHDTTAKMIGGGAVDFVAFTGSVPGGRAVEEAAAGRFVGVGLELGGKDPGYVRADADLDAAVDTLMDGAMFNSGQCCCGIERIYVHESLYDPFVAKAKALVETYKLGNPLEGETTLGPMAHKRFADEVRGQVKDAVAAGARALIDPVLFPADTGDSAYLAPQILVDVDHTMRVMREESFGPVVGIMKVSSDEEAIRLMNDSDYGLTVSLWTKDTDAAERIGRELETGTVFMNRCDYLDPALCWTGCKDTGRGASLSILGFHSVTRPKSYHLKKA